MTRSMQTAIIKKDLHSITANKRLFPVLIIMPLILTIVIPSIFILGIHLAPDEMSDLQSMIDLLPVSQQSDSLSHTLIKLILNNIMPIFFTMVPIMAASVMAASSFVGEKEKRTLETLLYCPLSLKQIFQAKVYASFLLGMAVSFVSFLVMLVVIETELLLTLGSIILPDASWLAMLFVVSPAVCLLAITLIVSGSAKAQTMEDSQQRAVFLIFPLLALMISQFTGALLINGWILLGLGIVLGILAMLMIKGAMRKFTYEILLR